jgi:uncharacterized protein involved in oxidation of intracellular sulfur
MNALIIFNRPPYDGTDVTWNGVDVRIFLMNDAVDMARDAARPPADYFNLGDMLKALIAHGVPVKVCGTCKSRCGLYKNEPYFNGANEATMVELAQWVAQTDRILTF